MRDLVVSILMSPDFCYRIDLVDEGSGPRPLSDYALASRLSYFLWASIPDEELLGHAAAGDLHKSEVLKTQARRMLKDRRVRRLATEFGHAAISALLQGKRNRMVVMKGRTTLVIAQRGHQLERRRIAGRIQRIGRHIALVLAVGLSRGQPCDQ